MSSELTPHQHIISLFDLQSCWMIKPLASKLGYSEISTRRFLRTAGYYSSFTQNGKWYTLRTIPKFDRDGLWFVDTIGFSRAGSLTNTLIDLTTRSSAGMTAEQLAEKLHCRCHSILVNLFRQGKLTRQKVGRSYIYFSADPSTLAMQKNVAANRSSSSNPLPAEVAVFILAEYIRQPDLDFEQLTVIIERRRGIVVDTTQIEALFARHDLKKTK
ncbi:MAG: hypothetical protein OEM02_12580 [Desulfobulbaceae bacterium]|nr:hypothetical protein [Desulfobulbaceae bacterium]